MLSRRTIEELKEERQRLRRQLLALEQLLGDSAPDPAAHERGVGEAVNLAHTPIKIEQNGTFASKVRAALAEVARVASSREVAEYMIANGSPEEMNGRPLKERVAVELFRSADLQRGVKKVSRGRYRVLHN